MVGGRESHITMNGKSRVTVYGAWHNRVERRGKPALVLFQLKMDILFMRDHEELDYVRC